MKKILFILFAWLLLNSCCTINKVIEVDDQYREIKSIKLRQQPSAYSFERNGHLGGRSSYYLTTNLISEIKSGVKPEVKIDFQFITVIRSDELDSVMYLVLDREKIKLVSTNYIFKQLMSREFIVPENLWVSIVHSKTVLYRLYIGREGIDVELTDSEMNKVREFFSRVIQQRDAMFPAIPEGKMKW